MKKLTPTILLAALVASLCATAHAETPYCDYHAVGEYGHCYKNFKPRFNGDRPIAGRDTPDESNAPLVAVGGCVAGVAFGYATGSAKIGAGLCAGSVLVGVGMEAANASEVPKGSELEEQDLSNSSSDQE